MARYDLYSFNGGLVVDLQADIVLIPGSRVCAPVLLESSVPRMTKSLHPKVIVDGAPHLIAIHLLSAMPEMALKAPVGNLASYGDQITLALDTLFQGF